MIASISARSRFFLLNSENKDTKLFLDSEHTILQDFSVVSEYVAEIEGLGEAGGFESTAPKATFTETDGDGHELEKLILFFRIDPPWRRAIRY